MQLWCSVQFPYMYLQKLCFLSYLHLNKDVGGQWSIVVAVWRAGCRSLTSLFPLGSGRLLLGDQLSHSPLHIPRVWSHRATHSLNHTIIFVLPLSSYQCWWWGNRKKILAGCPRGTLNHSTAFFFLFIYSGNDFMQHNLCIAGSFKVHCFKRITPCFSAFTT